MTDVNTRHAGRFTVDRDYMGAVGEDVQFRVWASVSVEEDLDMTLSPDEADELADALKHHAAEVRQINKENDRA